MQIFGVVEDLLAFSYVHKMKVMEEDGIENNTNEEFVTDFFYSTFKNDSKYLKGDVSVYGIIQEILLKLKISGDSTILYFTLAINLVIYAHNPILRLTYDTVHLIISKANSKGTL
ncbi:hypothetical protein [Cohnella mopanensis]|uniref:hypothetical protein n=1 Tax=Cohnella mopanensis TaxID=2911966 RepID=UPI001EF8FE96|nr:hypothetical protein [Cohnella mopanensis]